MNLVLLITVYSLGVVCFALTFAVTGLVESFGRVLTTTKLAIREIVDPALDDDAKEVAARNAALSLIKQSFVIIIKAMLTLAAASLPFAASHLLGLRHWSETTAFALRWDVLGITTVIISIIWLFFRRWRG